MAGISAADVMKLRKMSGQGMMDCKQALAETGGDVEEAMTLLRKKGLATMAKRAGRDTTEGKVVTKTEGNTTVMVSLCCETDFVAKNDDFIAVAEMLADVALKSELGADLNDADVNGKKFSEVITELVSKTGEKTEIGNWSKMTSDDNSVIGTYVHFNDKTGAMVKITCDSKSEDLVTVANEICMHITATKPLSLDKDNFDPEVIAKETEIAREQVKDKPAQIIDKIVEGKINKIIADNCLVNQKFVKNEEVTVEQAAKKAGGTKVVDFARITIE